MAAFDVVTRIIRHDSWDEGEEVVIKEPTYGESMKMAKASTKGNGEIDEFKMGDMMLINGIVSWTFTRDDDAVEINLPNIKSLPISYVTFIAEEIGEFTIPVDEDFPGGIGADTQGQGQVSAGNGNGDSGK